MLVLLRGHSGWKKKDGMSRCGGEKQEKRDQSVKEQIQIICHSPQVCVSDFKAQTTRR